GLLDKCVAVRQADWISSRRTVRARDVWSAKGVHHLANCQPRAFHLAIEPTRTRHPQHVAAVSDPVYAGVVIRLRCRILAQRTLQGHDNKQQKERLLNHGYLRMSDTVDSRKRDFN